MHHARFVFPSTKNHDFRGVIFMQPRARRTTLNSSGAIFVASRGQNKGDITATNPEKWRAWRDSNPQPSDPKSGAICKTWDSSISARFSFVLRSDLN
jgi:hypothetical protein